MAYLDDRIWCHPKFVGLSDGAGWLWTKGVAYSSGFATGGVLTTSVQKALGATTKTRRELVDAGLWDETTNGVLVHDWEEYNGKRDQRKAKDRERKRAAYRATKNGGFSAGDSTESPQETRGETAETSARRNDGEPNGDSAPSRALKVVKEVTVVTGVKEETSSLVPYPHLDHPGKAPENAAVRNLITDSLGSSQ